MTEEVPMPRDPDRFAFLCVFVAFFIAGFLALAAFGAEEEKGMALFVVLTLLTFVASSAIIGRMVTSRDRDAEVFLEEAEELAEYYKNKWEELKELLESSEETPEPVVSGDTTAA